MHNRLADSSPSPDLNDHLDGYGNPPVSPDRTLKTKRLLLDLSARWYWMALFAVIGWLGAAHYLAKAPKMYSSTATLLVKQRIAAVISKDQVEEIDIASMEGMNTFAAQIGRPELLERVASRVDVRALPGLIQPAVDWTPDWAKGWLRRARSTKPGEESAEKTSMAPPAPPVLGGIIGSRMSVSIRTGTRLMDVSISHEVPEVAKALADAVVREYLADIAGAVTLGRSTNIETLTRQVEEASERLQAAESAVANYNRALELHAALDQKETDTGKLARRYLPKHPTMLEASGELASLKSRFIAEFELAIQASADSEHWEKLKPEIEEAKADPERYLRLSRQLLLARTGVLQAEIASRMAVYNAMETRIQTSRVNSDGEESNASVSSLARVPGGAIAPIPKTVYTQAIAGGAFFGLLVAFLLVRMDNKYHSVAQVEADTGYPVLAAISNIELRDLDQAAKQQLKLGKGVVEETSAHLESWDPRLVFRPLISATNYAEMFRILRASITLLGDETERKITLFTSALPGEGKSMVSSNFALASSGQGRRTVLIDLDLRKPSIHRIFGKVRAEVGVGITEWLAGQATLEEVICRDVGCPNLHVIFAGQRAPNPGELLNTSGLKQLFQELSKSYDVIVVDSAPLLAVPDTRVIAPLVHNLCLVVRAEYLPKGALIRTIELLQSAETPTCGLVFNGFMEVRRMIGQNYSYGKYRMNRYGTSYRYSYDSYSEDRRDDDAVLKARRKKAKSRPS